MSPLPEIILSLFLPPSLSIRHDWCGTQVNYHNDLAPINVSRKMRVRIFNLNLLQSQLCWCCTISLRISHELRTFAENSATADSVAAEKSQENLNERNEKERKWERSERVHHERRPKRRTNVCPPVEQYNKISSHCAPSIFGAYRKVATFCRNTHNTRIGRDINTERVRGWLVDMRGACFSCFLA